MANETTTTSLTEVIQAAIREARVVASQGVDLTNYVQRDILQPGEGSASYPEFDEQVMASVAEGTDLTNTEFGMSEVTITPGEVGLMTTLTDLADRRSALNAAVRLGQVMGNAYRDKKNQDIYALCDGFSTAVGVANTDITLALIRSAKIELVAAKAPGRHIMPVTPWVLNDLIPLYETSSYSEQALRDMAMTNAELPMIEGVYPVLIDNLAAGTGAGQADEADTKTAVFSEFALGFVQEYDFRIEPQRDASLRANELVATASYGVGELKDSWGVEVLVDNKD